jgi:hypothetical protein
MMCRVLLNFLGVYFDRHGTPHPLQEKRAPRYPNSGDVWIENFSGLHAITLAHAIPAVAKVVPRDDAMKAIGRTLKAADKALGHLTINPAGSTVTRQEVKLTCEITIALLNKYFYDAQGDTPIAFEGEAAYAIVREIAPGSL